jgi:Tol biopolymer transport system component
VSGKDRSSIWAVAFAGGRPRRLTYGAWSDTRPRFSPDGRSIAFLSDREHEGIPQLLLLPLDGGEAQQVTSFRRGVLEAEWMPDGRALAVLATDDDSHVLVGERDADPDDRGDTTAPCGGLTGAWTARACSTTHATFTSSRRVGEPVG